VRRLRSPHHSIDKHATTTTEVDLMLVFDTSFGYGALACRNGSPPKSDRIATD
jgi:hypothetical protein